MHCVTTVSFIQKLLDPNQICMAVTLKSGSGKDIVKIPFILAAIDVYYFAAPELLKDYAAFLCAFC